MTWAPWEVLHNWAPFKIDALGLVTLLGAEEINSAVGRLVRSTYLEYLPLLGAFIIAGDRFTDKAAGFNLYNISEGIHTTELSAWLTRWMLSQDFEVTRSFVDWTVTPPKSRRHDIVVAAIIGFVLNGFLIALTLLSRDWYGFANAVAMIISILVRAYVIGQHRAAIDAMVAEVSSKSQSHPTANSGEDERRSHGLWKKENRAVTMKRDNTSGADPLPDADSSFQSSFSVDNTARSRGSSQQSQRMPKEQRPAPPIKRNPKNPKSKGGPGLGKTKVLIIQSDSKAVTFWMPKELLAPPSLFIEGPNLLHPLTYSFVRSLGWVAFAVHVVALGMADLASQWYTVVLLVLPSVLLVLKFGCDDSNWRPTIDGWRRSFLNGCQRRDTSKSDEVDETAKSGEFVKQRECWIGSRLKAEIYQWPASYEFTEEANGDGKGWTNRVLKGKERSRKRQDLYAWLALTPDEEQSMDKWDLFPHIRNKNEVWRTTYELKRDCLQPNPNFGPQREFLSDRQTVSPEPMVRRRQARPRRQSLVAPQMVSSAFPLSAIRPEDAGLVDSPRQMPQGNEAGPLDDGNALLEPFPNGRKPESASSLKED
ncbi:hypothetical protein A1O3_03626 [Capronia epimyces CBS 606.96]|uniref:Uncharacterized protein n=1 Tax=Capronia epimyces CBS 606.96 TaxID=1182542 RepID=W9Y2E0_9EURO|nr:uncharacterized protein A1O3_03626 [Capronia epimyces CBS 606.96]EXJ86673.1 hypothetical protein A1O3_03626 [Capronia epimyces CBS 606.96]